MKLIIVKCVQSGGGGQRIKKWNNKQNKLVYRENISLVIVSIQPKIYNYR